MLERFTWFKQSAYLWRGDGLNVYHRAWLLITTLLGGTAVALLTLSDPLPTYRAIVERTPLTIFSFAGIPVAVLVYPVYSVLCFILSLSALRRPEASERFMGDLARRRARPSRSDLACSRQRPRAP